MPTIGSVHHEKMTKDPSETSFSPNEGAQAERLCRIERQVETERADEGIENDSTFSSSLKLLFRNPRPGYSDSNRHQQTSLFGIFSERSVLPGLPHNLRRSGSSAPHDLGPESPASPTSLAMNRPKCPDFSIETSGQWH